MTINPNNMDTSDVSALIDYYCSDCCHNCDECLLKHFDSDLLYTIEQFNKHNS